MIAIHDHALPYREPPRAVGQGGKYDPTRDAVGFEWSPKDARNAVEFFPKCLTLTSGECAGRPFDLQLWQADYVATLHGWRDSSGARRYRESGFFTPRKNGKTETAAGLALYGLGADKEQRAQVYSAAKTRDQATMVFEPAAAMVRNSEVLRRRFEITPSRKQILFGSTASYYRAISADAGNAHGFNPHLVLFDELHTQSSRDLYDALRSGMGARRHPLFASFSTAGHNRLSICWEVWQMARRVRDGVLPESTFLPLIYELPDGADWKNEDVWRDCNPNLGVTISMEFLRAEFRKAQESPSYENTFRNLFLNEWTEQAVRWLPMEAWDDCDTIDSATLDGCECWAGLDMSSTRDLTAFCLAFPLADNRVAVLVWFWIPEDTARAAERSDHVPYRDWASRGLVTLTPGAQVDQERVRRDIVAIGERFRIREIACDRWNAGWITTALKQDGFDVVGFGQGMASMSQPAKELEKLVLAGNLLHGNNPVLRWMAANVAVEQDAAGNIKPTKAKSSGRIDGIVAATMATGRALSAEKVFDTFFVTG